MAPHHTQDYEHLGRAFCETLMDYSDDNPIKVNRAKKIRLRIKKLRKRERRARKAAKQKKLAEAQGCETNNGDINIHSEPTVRISCEKQP